LNFSFYIAKRYLFAKKSRNAINIITLISVIVVSVASAALIIVLSVFNGFDSIIRSMLDSYDPDFKIEAVKGKTFNINSTEFDEIKNLKVLTGFVEVIEENVLLKSDDKQVVASIKGVSANYADINKIDSMILEGEFKIDGTIIKKAVFGAGLAGKLALWGNNTKSVSIWVPNRKQKTMTSGDSPFKVMTVFPYGIVSVDAEFDVKYVISSIENVRTLTSRDSFEVSYIETSTLEEDKDAVQEKLQQILGENFVVKNRIQQHEMMYKIMQSEKWAIFLILSFIIVLASFSIIGSLVMLIIEKRKDISTLSSMGADSQLISRIFLYEGWLISFSGAFLGLFLGGVISWLQQEFGFVKFPSTGNFVINSYPVELRSFDFLVTFIAVSVIGFLTSLYPVFVIRKKIIAQ